jgi:hypothetical protein
MKELIEKLTAIRKDLMAFQALVPEDAKLVVEQGMALPFQNNPRIQQLADLVKQKYPAMQRTYDDELGPYMNNDQKSRATWAFVLNGFADNLAATGQDHLTGGVMRFVPPMLADLDDIAKKLENNAAPAPKS